MRAFDELVRARCVVTVALLTAACSHAANAPQAPASSNGLAPETPAVAAVPGGRQTARIARVRLTYARGDGESPASAEVMLPLGPGMRVRIESPRRVAGSAGYDVYAAIAGRDGVAAATLQNTTPITFGTPYVEAPEGLRTDGRFPPESGAETVETVPADGANIELPAVSGSVSFSANDGRGAAVATLTALPLRNGEAGAAFTFSRDLRFEALPDFSFAATAPDALDAAILELRDASAARTIAAYDRNEYGALSFWGRPWHEGSPPQPFVALAGHRYEAVLHRSTPGAIVLDTVARQRYVAGADGISLDLRVPPPSSGAARLILRVTKALPLGVPNLSGPSVGAIAAYVTLVTPASAVYDGDASAAIRLAPPAAAGIEYALASYDPGRWSSGWTIGIARDRADEGRRLTFRFDLHGAKLFPRKYVFALYALRREPPTSPQRAGRDARPLLAVIGDSSTLVENVAPSAPHCPGGFASPPTCQYRFSPGGDYATIAGNRDGYRVLNLSYLGTETTHDDALGESAAGLQVPQIPRDAAVVVLSAGVLDVALAASGDVSSRLDALTDAVRVRVPQARIVYAGLRPFGASPAADRSIGLWNARAARLGARYGAYLDLRALLPDGYSALTPDGVHFTASARAIVAKGLERVLAARSFRR